MTTTASEQMNKALISSLYAEALLLADEARAWFDQTMGDGGDASNMGVATASDKCGSLFGWAGRHDPSLRIALSCESLRLTTRLMHIIAWLLLQRAVMAGEVDGSAARKPENRLGPSPISDHRLCGALPPEAQRMIENSERLHARVAKLDAALVTPLYGAEPPVRDMQSRLQSLF